MAYWIVLHLLRKKNILVLFGQVIGILTIVWPFWSLLCFYREPQPGWCFEAAAVGRRAARSATVVLPLYHCELCEAVCVPHTNMLLPFPPYTHYQQRMTHWSEISFNWWIIDFYSDWTYRLNLALMKGMKTYKAHLFPRSKITIDFFPKNFWFQSLVPKKTLIPNPELITKRSKRKKKLRTKTPRRKNGKQKLGKQKFGEQN